MSESCCAATDLDCRALPVLGFRARAVCFACGQAVCTSPGCSTIIEWHHYGRRRVCANCQREEAKIEPRKDSRHD